MRMRILSSVACPAVRYFSTLSTNGTIFEKKKKIAKYKMFVVITSKTFDWKISHYEKNERDIIKNVYWSSFT